MALFQEPLPELGRYRPVRCLSRSPSSEVWLVKRGGLLWVLRRGQPGATWGGDVRSYARLSGRGFARPEDWGRLADGTPFAARPYLEADPFDRAASRATHEELVGWVQSLLAELETLHRQGLVHRDLRAENVLVLPDRIVLADFDLMVSNGTHGPGPMSESRAPELLLGHPYRPAAELFSLGAMLARSLARPTRRRTTHEFPRTSFWQASGLDPGSMSEIVESPFGFHLIRVEEVREARTRPIEEVREEIVVELARKVGKEKARDAAGAMAAGLAEGRSFDELVVETGASLVDPPAIARGAVVEGLGRSIPLTEALFGLADGGTTGVVQVGERQVIGRLDAKNPSKTPPLEEVRSRVVADYRRAEAVKQGKAQAEALVAAAREAGSLDEAAAAAGREIQVSAEVERPGPFVASMGADPELKEAIFSLSEENPVAEGTFDFLGDAIVVGLGEVNVPSDEDVEISFSAERDALLRSSRIQLMRRYIDELKAAANVQINTVVLDQLPPV